MASPNPKLAAVPKGFRSITASVTVSDVQAAIDFYTAVLKAETTEFLTEPNSDVVIYAQIKISGTSLFLIQDKFALPTAGTGSLSLHHYLDDFEDTYQAALEAGAVAISPVTPTWWGDLNAVLIDPFGIRWNLAKRVERLSNDEKTQRLQELYQVGSLSEVLSDAPEAEAPEVPLNEIKDVDTLINADI